MKQHWQTVSDLLVSMRKQDRTIRNVTEEWIGRSGSDVILKNPLMLPSWMKIESIKSNPDIVIVDKGRRRIPDHFYLPSNPKATLNERDWMGHSEAFVYGGGYTTRGQFYLASRIKSELTPPYRYEFVPRKHLIIIGKDDRKYIMMMHSKDFPQKLVDLLEGEN